jgi:outer membrane protein assembly factor BamA
MTMGQPFPGIWLPREMDVHGAITLANGSYEAGYSRAFKDYREADVKSRIRVPKESALRPDAPTFPPQPAPMGDPEPAGGESGPYVLDDGQARDEIVREIRVHGNAYLADQDVIGLAEISIGAPLGPDAVGAIRKRLEDSGRFESVEVRKRYRSLTDPTDVAIVLVVHEKPEIRSISDDPTSVFNPIRRVKHRLMFLPIVTYADGYGFTYGGRVSTVGLLGFGERLSVPLTWGGVRRAAIEFDRQFTGGPLTRIESSFGIASRENPRFDIRDRRVELRGRAEKVFGDVLRFGVDAGRSTISFAELDDRLTTVGANAAFDTRGDPAYPSNAVLLSTGWTGLHFRSRPGRVNRYTNEARGYLRVYRQAVVAARLLHVSADAALPPYERLLLGGSSTVRGFRTGAFDGDRLLAASAELRVPITSVLSGAKLGLTAFYDAGQTWNVGESRDAAAWRRGAGGGVFLIASIVRINLDVARAFRTGDTRVHLSAGFTY